MCSMKLSLRAPTYEAGKGLHNQGGPHDQKKIARIKVRVREPEEAIWQTLAEENYVWLHLPGT